MDRFFQLFQAYIQQGTFFALLHLILFFVVLGEIRAFSRWTPRSGSWEELEARSDYIRGIVGLFLVVGVMGTFFGLYEVFGGGLTSGLEGRLKSASAKAFPVGFMGLMLSLVFSAWTDLLQKRKARLLEQLRSPAVALEDLVKVTNRRLEAIEASLGPVARLQGTLSESLQPLIRELGGSLDKAREVLEAQGKRLEEGKDALVDSSARLEESAKKIATSIRGLTKVSEATEKVLAFVQAIEGQSNEVFRIASSQIWASSESVAQASVRAAGAMTSASQELTAALQAIPPEARNVSALLEAESSNANSAWTALYGDALRLAENLAALQQRIEASSRTVSEELPRVLKAHLEDVTRDVWSTADNTLGVLRVSVDKLRIGVHSDVEEILTVTPSLFDQITKKALETIQPQMIALTDAYGGAYKDFLKQMESLTKQMEVVNDRLGALADKHGGKAVGAAAMSPEGRRFGPAGTGTKVSGDRLDVTHPPRPASSGPVSPDPPTTPGAPYVPDTLPPERDPQPLSEPTENGEPTAPIPAAVPAWPVAPALPTQRGRNPAPPPPIAPFRERAPDSRLGSFARFMRRVRDRLTKPLRFGRR